MTNLTIPDEAVEAAGTAIYETFKDMRFHPVTTPARTALEAALPILHPAIPNTAEALNALPEAAIIRHELGELWVKLAPYLWAAGPSDDEVGTIEVTERFPDDSEWTVLWPLGGAA